MKGYCHALFIDAAIILKVNQLSLCVFHRIVSVFKYGNSQFLDMIDTRRAPQSVAVNGLSIGSTAVWLYAYA